MMVAGPNGISKLSLDVNMTVLMLCNTLRTVQCKLQDGITLDRSPPFGNSRPFALKAPISICSIISGRGGRSPRRAAGESGGTRDQLPLVVARGRRFPRDHHSPPPPPRSSLRERSNRSSVYERVAAASPAAEGGNGNKNGTFLAGLEWVAS